jgi:hypothetical protein
MNEDSNDTVADGGIGIGAGNGCLWLQSFTRSLGFEHFRIKAYLVDGNVGDKADRFC